MKNFKLITTILIMVISIVGCQLNQEVKNDDVSTTFTKAVEEGKLAVAENDYIKASSLFTLALEEKDDEDISKLNKQCKLVIEVLKIADEFENEEIDEDNLESKINRTYEICDEIINIESKSNLIKDKAKEVKKEFEIIKKEFEESKKEEMKSNEKTQTKSNKTLCSSCGKNYIEDNKEWQGEDKCDNCINEIVNSHADNYGCVICGNKTDTLCQYDQCAPLCEDDMGYYCECGEYHHTQELCPVYDI